MIIIITGLPGSGKSFLASRLAAKTGAVYVNSDKVRKAMGTMGKYTLKDKLAVYREMAKLTETSVAENKTVVVDATFYRQPMRDLFIIMARRRALKVIFIRVWAKEALIKERMKKPREDSEADLTVYYKIRTQYEKITGPVLILESTNENITQMVREAINYIRSYGRNEN